jgi:hypothetical protein
VHPFALAGRVGDQGAAQRRTAALPLDQDQPDRTRRLGYQHHPCRGRVAWDPLQHHGWRRAQRPCRREPQWLLGRMQLDDQPVADLEVHGSAVVMGSDRDRGRWDGDRCRVGAERLGPWLGAAGGHHKGEDRQQQRPQAAAGLARPGRLWLPEPWVGIVSPPLRGRVRSRLLGRCRRAVSSPEMALARPVACY